MAQDLSSLIYHYVINSEKYCNTIVILILINAKKYCNVTGM